MDWTQETILSQEAKLIFEEFTLKFYPKSVNLTREQSTLFDS